MRCRTAEIAVVSLAFCRSVWRSRGISDSWIMTMVRRHCVMCHSGWPLNRTTGEGDASSLQRVSCQLALTWISHWNWSGP